MLGEGQAGQKAEHVQKQYWGGEGKKTLHSCPQHGSLTKCASKAHATTAIIATIVTHRLVTALSMPLQMEIQPPYTIGKPVQAHIPTQPSFPFQTPSIRQVALPSPLPRHFRHAGALPCRSHCKLHTIRTIADTITLSHVLWESQAYQRSHPPYNPKHICCRYPRVYPPTQSC